MKKSQNIAFADTEKIKVKRANFRSWKKGKKWLFASSLIVTVIGAGALDSGKTVKADEVTPETIKIAASIDQAPTNKESAEAQQAKDSQSSQSAVNTQPSTRPASQALIAPQISAVAAQQFVAPNAIAQSTAALTQTNFSSVIRSFFSCNSKCCPCSQSCSTFCQCNPSDCNEGQANFRDARRASPNKKQF